MLASFSKFIEHADSHVSWWVAWWIPNGNCLNNLICEDIMLLRGKDQYGFEVKSSNLKHFTWGNLEDEDVRLWTLKYATVNTIGNMSAFPGVKLRLSLLFEGYRHEGQILHSLESSNCCERVISHLNQQRLWEITNANPLLEWKILMLICLFEENWREDPRASEIRR